MRRVETSDGRSLAVAFDGPADAPAVVLLHSIGCDHRLWDPQVAALAGYRVVRPDIRGHGASEAPAGDYSLGRLVADLVEILDQLGIGSAHVCGLSLGGVIAQAFALKFPERVRTLVLANTLPRIGDAEGWRARAERVRADGVAAIADLAMERFFSEPFRHRAPEVVWAARRQLLATSADGYAGCCAALRDADLTADAVRLEAPTLVIAGAHDVSTPAAAMGAFAAAVADARVIELEAGHLSNLEQPDAFAAALLAHLEAADG